MTELVSIGVPVIRGTKFVGEALQSIRFRPTAISTCSFRSTVPAVQRGTLLKFSCAMTLNSTSLMAESQLGWAGNISFLMSQNKGAFWYFHQQDDIVSPDYVQSLLRHKQASQRCRSLLRP